MTFLTKKRHITRGVTGFTLIELLVVIAIIGVLASIVLASLNTARKKSRDTRRIADMSQAKLALELFYDSKRVYPLLADLPSFLSPTYIATWPSDPITGTAYPYIGLVTSPGGASNATCTDADGGTCQYFHMGAEVEDTTIAAMNTDADRCPNTTTPCTSANNNGTAPVVLAATTIYGADGTAAAVGSDCISTTAAPGRGCYDITP